MKRNSYAPIIDNSYDVSLQNEPFRSVPLSIDAQKYPPMHSTYSNFSKKYNIPINNFILTNGCENALRIAMIAARIKSITLESPTWELSKVICESFDIEYKLANYKYENYIFFPEKEMIAGNLYTTDTFNNLFKHENMMATGITILDETYTAKRLLSTRKDFLYNDNQVVIGSFSKIVGAGLRLGYCLFSDQWSERFNLLREQYISAAASKWIIDNKAPSWNYPVTAIPPQKVVTQHPVYITVEQKDVSMPHKKFTVSGISFCRVGTKEYMNDLIQDLR